MTRADVDDFYPKAERFREVRRERDREGKFMNDYLKPLFS